MRIIAPKQLIDFYSKSGRKDAEMALKAWLYEAKQAGWESPADIKKLYKHASIVKNNRVVFNICGGKYRLIVKFHYNTGIGYIRFIGTHAEYDKIDAETV